MLLIKSKLESAARDASLNDWQNVSPDTPVVSSTLTLLCSCFVCLPGTQREDWRAWTQRPTCKRGHTQHNTNSPLPAIHADTNSVQKLLSRGTSLSNFITGGKIHFNFPSFPSELETPKMDQWKLSWCRICFNKEIVRRDVWYVFKKRHHGWIDFGNSLPPSPVQW